MLAVKSPMVMALEGARAYLEQAQDWDQSGEGPGLCPIRAMVKAANNLDLGWWSKVRLVFRLRAALPASHRGWWPECVIQYNADPAVSHADVLAWFDRAIDAS
jgi:hypothetical protein